MYNSEKTASRQNKWGSLMICRLIILGGYLLIRMVFLIFGLLFPAVAEKLTLYFLGAYLCGISPLRVTTVMEAIGRTEPYTVLFTRMPMRYAINLLFFNPIYILCGVAFAALCAFGLFALQKRAAD